MPERSQRKQLRHITPVCVPAGSVYFLTVCCRERGTEQLSNPLVFGRLVAALEHYVLSGKWWVKLFLVMPDHWHALVSFPDAERMDKVVRDWKRYTAKNTGVVWQDGFFEHRLRSSQSAEEKWHYIRANPMRRQLVSGTEQWPYCWMP